MQSSNQFPKLRLRAYAPIQDRETPEARYWKEYSEYREEKLLGTPMMLQFNPFNGRSYIVTHSTKVSLYHSSGDKLQRSYSRFTEDAYSGRFRKDGKLIVAGSRAGYIKVFDVKTKSALRQIHGHTAATRAVDWSSDGLSIISASDDKKVKRWDLGTEELLWQTTKSTNQHTDYVRTLAVSPVNPSGFVSGSYDHTVRLWDSRQSGQVNCMDHGNPVESVIIAPSGALVISAGSNEVKIWDVLSGGKLLHTFSNHQKNVSGLCMNSSGSKLLSCGLDGFVKVYSMETLQVNHGMKYQGPCVNVCLSPDDSKLLVGLVDGTLVIKNRSKGISKSTFEEDEEGEPAKPSESVTKRQRLFFKGAGAAVLSTEEGMVEAERSIKLQPYETHLKKFNYQQALDEALLTRNPVIAVTVLEELCRRNGLTIALSGRDESSLEPLLSFTAKFISNPRYSRLVSQVAHSILDIYSPVIGQSDAVDELFLKLYQQVKLEVSFQKQVRKVASALDGVINMSGMTALRQDTYSETVEDE